jgi:hypothetical protein
VGLDLSSLPSNPRSLNLFSLELKNWNLVFFGIFSHLYSKFRGCSLDIFVIGWNSYR